jgi:hypothetical protein
MNKNLKVEPEKVKKPPTEKQLAAREAMKVKHEAAKAKVLIFEREAEAAAKKAEAEAFTLILEREAVMRALKRHLATAPINDHHEDIVHTL